MNLPKLKDDSKIGLLLECDLEYPSELNDLRNDYPLAPAKNNMEKRVLSKYCKK